MAFNHELYESRGRREWGYTFSKKSAFKGDEAMKTMVLPGFELRPSVIFHH